MKTIVMKNDKSLSEKIKTLETEAEIKKLSSLDVKFVNYEDLWEVLSCEKIVVVEGEQSKELLAFAAGFNAFASAMFGAIQEVPELKAEFTQVGLAPKKLAFCYDRDEIHPKYDFALSLGEFALMTGGREGLAKELALSEEVSSDGEDLL